LKKNGASQKSIPGAYSAKPVSGIGGGIMLFGVYEKWEPGNYLVVYRVQLFSNVVGDNICFLDVCSGGNTKASRRPKSTEFEKGQWIDMPVVLHLDKATEIEYRLWPNNHQVALDRVYIYKLP
jgi:hypothetical protein